MIPGKRKNLLFFFLTAETLLAGYGLLLGRDTGVVSVLYLIAGLCFIFVLLGMPQAKLPHTWLRNNNLFLKLLFIFIMIVLAVITSRYWMEEIPLDPDFADMLPVIKVMNERLLQGHVKQVYEPIPEIWNGVHPIYLPAMWLPYLPAVLLRQDIRWVTVITLLMSFTVIIFLIRIKGNIWMAAGQLVLVTILFWWLFSRNEVHGLVSMSEEGVVIFYYVLLALAIISENAFLTGIAVALCLLSRYSMIGWLIPFCLFLLVRKNYRSFFIFSGTVAFSVCLLFLLPFGWKTIQEMTKIPATYISFAKQVWDLTPEVFWLNLGMAKFFGRNEVDTLHRTLIISSFGIPLLFMCFALFQRKWKLQNINLACFKLSLLVFYQFIDVPYGYLFYTCSFLSMVITASLIIPREQASIITHPV